MKKLAPIALLFLAACGGSDPKHSSTEGFAALGKGDAKVALEKFDAALAGIDSTHPEFLRASIGRCEALAKIDGAKASKSFLDLAAKVPAEIGEDDYSLICSKLLSGGFTLEAIDVMDAGNKRFPTSEKMKQTHEAVLNAAKREKTPDALKKLESLGYAGK